MSPLSRGLDSHIPSMDSIFLLTGASHPSIRIHLVIAIEFLILGLGSLETSTLLPIPLYSCWGTLNTTELGEGTCDNLSFTKSDFDYSERKILHCGDDDWWQLTHWAGGVLAITRLLVAISSGVAMDSLGRKPMAIFWCCVYFVASLARSFAPNKEVLVAMVTIEALSNQLVTLALILIATEGSTQKESVRSACLVLLGHAFSILILVPVAIANIPKDLYLQLTRSIPSIYFVILIFCLPESVRWLASRGRLDDVAITFKKSHNVIVEDSLKPKISAVYNEMRKYLGECRSRGNPVRQALCPLLFARPLWRVFLPFVTIAFLVGSAIGFRLIDDPLPYNSLEDRLIACGVAELFALLFLGLMMSRLPVRRITFLLGITFAVILLLTKALTLAGYPSCVNDIFFSSSGHFLAVMLSVWLFISVIRTTPTHCRATVLGSVVGFATVGHGISLLIYNSVTIIAGWHEYVIALVYAGVVIICCLLCLILPSTPYVMPDMPLHIAPHLYWPEENGSVSSRSCNNHHYKRCHYHAGADTRL